MKIRKILLNNLGLKLLALLLALATWLYVGEATKLDREKTVLQKILSSYYISKTLYIKPVFAGEAPRGYEFVKNDVTVTPESIMIIGPGQILSKKEYLYTKPIDLSEYTKAKTLDVELEGISRSIKFPKTKAEVFLPIKKIPVEK